MGPCLNTDGIPDCSYPRELAKMSRMMIEFVRHKADRRVPFRVISESPSIAFRLHDRSDSHRNHAE